MTTYNFVLPLKQEEINKLKIKDLVYLSGTIYTARDVAHQKLFQLIQNNQPLPFELKNNIIYYTGPSPALPGMIIGSAGPTTSKRMDKFTPRLYDLGLKITIGKGERSQEVFESIKRNQGLYLAAVGGTGVLLHNCITKCEVIAFKELGPEAIYKLEVKNFPVIVFIDAFGNKIN